MCINRCTACIGGVVAVGYLKSDAFDYMERVNDIAQGLGHLAAMGITHHGVQIHLLEGHLPCITPLKSHPHTQTSQT